MDLLKNYYLYGASRQNMQKYGVQKLWIGIYIISLGRASHARLVAKHPEIFEKRNTDDVLPRTIGSYLFGSDNVALSNGEVWRKYRKVMNPAFRLVPPMDVFEQCTEVMLEEWSKIWKDHTGEFKVDVHDWFGKLTLDVLGRCYFASCRED